MTEKLSERAFEVLRMFDLSASYFDPNQGRNHISGQEHALRCAALLNQRSKDLWLPFAGLIHDLGRPLNDVHHGEVIAEIVRDRVPEYIYYILYTHGQYQDAIMHNNETPNQPSHILASRGDKNDFQKLAVMFAACEDLSFTPTIEVDSLWSYNVAKSLIVEVLN